MTIDFDGPYDKAMKQVEDLAYYANAKDDVLKRLLSKDQRGKHTNEAVREPVEPETLERRLPDATD